jgi:hypothetical protein
MSGIFVVVISVVSPLLRFIEDIFVPVGLPLVAIAAFSPAGSRDAVTVFSGRDLREFFSVL